GMQHAVKLDVPLRRRADLRGRRVEQEARLGQAPDTPPAATGAAAEAEEQADRQPTDIQAQSRSDLRATSAFSSSLNCSSSASLKANRRARITSGNCSIRTLFRLTASLYSSRRSAMAFSRPEMRCCRCWKLSLALRSG